MSEPEVTFVLPGLVPSGGTRAVFEIADRLRALGRETAIVVPERSLLASKRTPVGALQRYLPASLVPLVAPFAPRRAIEQTWFDLQTPLRLLQSWGISAQGLPSSGTLVATSYRTAEELSRDSRTLERAVYFIQHEESWSGSAHRVDTTWRRFDRMIVTAEWLRERAVERFGKGNVGLAVCGVDHKTFKPRDVRGASAPSDLPTVGFMWDDRPWKGGADLLAALTRLRRPHRAIAYGLGTGAALPASVAFRGRLAGEDLADFYRSIDLFVSASHSDSGPLTVPEAMACAVPVVATDVGCVRVWSNDGTGCRIVSPRNVGSLAAAIDGLLADEVERARIGSAGRAAIAAFTWERTARSFEDTLVRFGVLRERTR